MRNMQMERASQTRTVEAGRQIKPTSSITSPLRTSAPSHPILQLQQIIGNQAMQHLLRSGAIQPKLAISQPGDIYEQEADRVADEVMRMPAPVIQGSCPACAAGGKVCSTCETEKQRLVQRNTEQDSDSSDFVPDDFLRNLGPGQPLDSATRAFFE